MKIIYLHQYFNTPTMAGGTRSYEMARRLTAAGHEVHMVTSWRKDDNRRGWYRTEDAGIQVHWLPVPYSNRMKYPARIKAFCRFAFAAARKAASLGGDIIFATSTPLTIALSAVYAARRNRIPMVFEVRDLWPEVPIAVGALKSPVLKMAARWLERFAYHNSRHIVVLSPGMKEGVIKTGYPAERVTVIPNGCDIDFFNTGPEPGKLLRQQYPWLQDRPLVIYAGTIGTVNGVDYLARIAAAVGDLDKEVRILIIGEGIGEKKLHQEAKKLGVVGNNLFVMPKIPKEFMPGWLAAADMAFSVFIDTKAMWANS
ncbi:MAG: glycosyltransferase family 4 protein, partial [Lentisphaerae bacterium]|nr:glycosyltransferase family 4 protein [Lentisphaerota bacterium]